jgi:hypothetical protein
MLLLLALVGALLLAWLTTTTPTTMGIASTVVYDVLVVIPIVWLYSRGQ